MISLNNYKDFISFKSPIDFGEFEAIGMFPYQTANLKTTNCPPRILLEEVEQKLKEYCAGQNKYVVIFRSKNKFGTNDFAVMFKDLYCKVDRIENITTYNGQPLSLK